MLQASVHTTFFMVEKPLLPIDIEYGVFTPELSEAITYKYVQELKSRLEHAFNKANLMR